MNFYDYCDALNLDLRLIRYSNQNNRWTAIFHNVDANISSHGNGKNPEEAIQDYINSIVGKVIVLNSFKNDRREYLVPNNLEI